MIWLRENWRRVFLVAAISGVAVAYVVGRSVGPLCPVTGERTTKAEITRGALVFAAAELRRYHEISALGDNATAGPPMAITPERLASEQPDCCSVERNPPEGMIAATERVRIRQPGPAVYAYFNVTVDTPALLPPMVASYDIIVSVDVCGQPVQDWLDIDPPASE